MISPPLANIYLREVLDLWIRERVAPTPIGPVHLIRYADDIVLLFRPEDDARRVFAALPKRFAEYGLELQPSKARLVEFRQPPYRQPTPPHESFDFLAFTHHWGRSRKGGWIVKRKTARDRLSRSLDRVRKWCREHRHDPMRSQHQVLSANVRGHYAYFGIRGNARCPKAYHDEVRRIWKKWLGRRCWKGKLFWRRFERLIPRYPLPPPRLPRRPALP